MTKRLREGDLLVAVIGEEVIFAFFEVIIFFVQDLVTGLLLTGLGNIDGSRNTNYFICDESLYLIFLFFFLLGCLFV
jgi:hypothetical protein